MLAQASKIFVFLHILAGCVTLIAGPIAIFYNFKDSAKHRLSGKVFFYAMLFVCVSAVIGFIKQPEVVFYQFLFGISIFVFLQIIIGVRAMLFMKSRAIPTMWDYGVAVLGSLVGLSMVGYAVFKGLQSPDITFPILFGVFGTALLRASVKSLLNLRKFEIRSKNFWYKTHIGNMMGGLMGSTTAFMVNVLGNSLPWFVIWFGPTVVLTPLVIYFVRKLKLNQHSIAGR